MDWPDVLQRIQAGESRQIEFKRALEFRQIGRALVAFANTEGGVLVLGVDDAGVIVGVPGDPAAVQERLTNFLQNGCNAPVRATCGWRETPCGCVHWLDVPRQRGFEPLRYDGRAWVRRGRSSVEPSPMELQELYNAFGYILTEEQTIPAAGIEDVDLATFRGHLVRQGLNVVEAPQPAVADDLLNRGVVGEFDGRLHPTLFGLLAFGKHPQLYPHTGNFKIDCVAYDGFDQAAETILVGEAGGRLDEQVDRALGWARGLLGHTEKYEGMRRIDIPQLPTRALREALVNAVVHRDYAIIGGKTMLEVFRDRIQVTSPGALPNHMSVASVTGGGRTRSRNEQMANYMLDRRYMERRGRGWLLMAVEMRDFNGSEPLLENDAESRFVSVAFRL